MQSQSPNHALVGELKNGSIKNYLPGTKWPPGSSATGKTNVKKTELQLFEEKCEKPTQSYSLLDKQCTVKFVGVCGVAGVRNVLYLG